MDLLKDHFHPPELLPDLHRGLSQGLHLDHRQDPRHHQHLEIHHRRMKIVYLNFHRKLKRNPDSASSVLMQTLKLNQNMVNPKKGSITQINLLEKSLLLSVLQKKYLTSRRGNTKQSTPDVRFPKLITLEKEPNREDLFEINGEILKLRVVRLLLAG